MVRSKVSFFVLCFGAFLNWVSYGLVYPIFAVAIYHQNSIFLNVSSDVLRGFWLGVLLSACPLAQFVSSPTIGKLSDKKGRKPILQISTLIIALGALLCTFGIWGKSLYLLIFGRVVTGIGAGNIATINSSVADISTSSEKAKNFALIAMANGIGFAVGPFLGGLLSVYGFEMPFIFALLATIANFFLITFFFSETLPKKSTSDVPLANRLQHIWKTTIAPQFRIIFPAFFLFCFGWSFYWEFIPVTWIKNYGLNVSQIGNFYAFGSIIYVLSSGVLIRPILNRFKGLSILFISLAILGVFLLLLFQANIESYWLNVAAQQFLIALIFPVSTAIVSDLAPKSQQGETLGVFQSLQALAFALTPFMGGAVLDLSYNSPYLVGGIVILISCLILLAGYRRKLFH
jgi:MFS transporter, DHA1 family, tetracycline resistance protein